MIGWHHRFNGHELGQILGYGEGKQSLVCCSPWGGKELDMTWQVNNNSKNLKEDVSGQEGSIVCNTLSCLSLDFLCLWCGSVIHSAFLISG